MDKESDGRLEVRIMVIITSEIRGKIMYTMKLKMDWKE
jgi:hypothetical protein